MYNKDTASNDFKTAKKTIDQTVEEVTDNITDIAHNAGRKMRRVFDDATDEVTDAGEAVVSQIRKNPVQSSMVALGVGFLLGALFRR